MKIGIEAGVLGVRDKRLKVGVYQMASEMFRLIGKKDHENEYLLYSFYPIDSRLMSEFGPRMKNIVVRPARGWLKVWLPLRLRKDKPDVFVGLSQALPIRPGIEYKTVGFIHDLLFMKRPEFYPEKVDKMTAETKRLVRNSDIIVAVSENTKKDLVEKFNVPRSKIKVIYTPIKNFSKNVKTGNYFLFVGALKKSKNLANIISAFNMYLKDYKSDSVLYIVGGDLWMGHELLNKINRNKKIKFLGYVSDSYLSSLYSGAIALISPSFYEGFGLPLAESIKAGVPVVSGNRSSEKEIVGKAGILVDPQNVKEISTAIANIQKNNKLYRKNAKIEAKKFNPDKSVNNFLKILKQYEKKNS